MPTQHTLCSFAFLALFLLFLPFSLHTPSIMIYCIFSVHSIFHPISRSILQIGILFINIIHSSSIFSQRLTLFFAFTHCSSFLANCYALPLQTYELEVLLSVLTREYYYYGCIFILQKYRIANSCQFFTLLNNLFRCLHFGSLLCELWSRVRNSSTSPRWRLSTSTSPLAPQLGFRPPPPRPSIVRLMQPYSANTSFAICSGRMKMNANGIIRSNFRLNSPTKVCFRLSLPACPLPTC